MTFPQALDLSKQLRRENRLGDAESVLRQILAARPDWGDARVNLADLLVAQNRVPEAVEQLQIALGCQPSNPVLCLQNLAFLFSVQERFAQAADCLREAIRLAPTNAELHRLLGDILVRLNQFEEAETCYQQCLSMAGESADVHVQIGVARYHRRLYREACEQFERALAIDPTNRSGLQNAVLCKLQLGESREADLLLERFEEIQSSPQVSSGRLMILNYQHGDQPDLILRETRRRALKCFGNSDPPARGPKLQPSADGKLRVGFVSPDFREHSVSYFLADLFDHYNRDRLTFACYSGVLRPDATTEFFKSRSEIWRDIREQSDLTVAEWVRADRIDILIDLAGHTDGNRLGLFSLRPAPIQLTWLGYPGTTGVPGISFRLTDGLADPQGAEMSYTEKLIRLPRSFFVYRPPECAPEVGQLPKLKNGFTTFGSFNSLAKLNPSLLQLWGQILSRVPQSRLLITGACEQAGPMLRTCIGVDPQRVELVGPTGLRDYLELFGKVDIALDSFPWAGHTTTCHALWMGVPVISLAGRSAVSRAGISVLSNLQLDDQFAASDPDGYVSKAIQWARQTPELAALRSGLRLRMSTSPLMQARQFAKDFELELFGIAQRVLLNSD
jgi:predicted O-linked N-acetylglucosamine transferase (SPINDLY family)